MSRLILESWQYRSFVDLQLSVSLINFDLRYFHEVCQILPWLKQSWHLPHHQCALLLTKCFEDMLIHQQLVVLVDSLWCLIHCGAFRVLTGAQPQFSGCWFWGLWNSIHGFLHFPFCWGILGHVISIEKLIYLFCLYLWFVGWTACHQVFICCYLGNLGRDPGSIQFTL